MNRNRLAFVSAVVVFGSIGSALAADPVVSQGSFVTPDVALAHSMAQVAVDGTTLVVGYLDANDVLVGAGAAYVAERGVNGKWTQTAKLLPSININPHDFGEFVALHGDTAAVTDPNAASGFGAVCVFERSGGIWSQTAQFFPIGPTSGNAGPIALAQNDLIVGCPTMYSGTSFSGGVFFYKRSGATWILAQGPVFPFDVATGGQYARAVAIDGDVAATSFGLAGWVYVFERANSGAPWSQVQKLAPTNGFFDLFGDSISVSGDWLAVGAPDDDQLAQDAGAVRMFLRVAPAQWVEQPKVTAADGAGGDEFGHSVSLHGDRLVVGAYRDMFGTHSNAGSAYVFQRQANGTWTQISKLKKATQATDDLTGTSVSIGADGAIAVSVPGNVSGIGSVLMYDAETLSCNAQTISLSAGGAATLDVQAGASNAGRTYLVAGSISGTSPGLLLPGGLTLPLVYDGYTQLTFTAPNNSILSNSFAALGTGGGAQATFTLPAGSPAALVGITVDHAFLVLNASSTLAVLASNPIAFTLVP